MEPENSYDVCLCEMQMALLSEGSCLMTEGAPEIAVLAELAAKGQFVETYPQRSLKCILKFGRI